MDIILFNDKGSWIHRLDPRARLIGATVLTLLLSQRDEVSVLSLGCAVGVAGLFLARVPLAASLQRLVPLNALVGFLFVVLLFATPGDVLFRIGSVDASTEGLHRASVILLKANAIVLLLTSLVGTIEFVALGRALEQLHVPAKLVNILLFTVRYIILMLTEYERLSQAALLRGFQPGANRHTLRTTGYLIGMVLVRSYERGGRMVEAMKLRGYDGTLRWAHPTAFQRRDLCFLTGVGGMALLLLSVGWR